MTDAAAVLRDALADGQRVDGPAVVIEEETTLVLPASRSLIAQSDGCLDITINASAAAAPAARKETANV